MYVCAICRFETWRNEAKIGSKEPKDQEDEGARIDGTERVEAFTSALSLSSGNRRAAQT